MNITDAFKVLIEDLAACEDAGMKDGNRRLLKHRLINTDPMLTIQTMMYWLERAGWTYKMTWHEPAKNKIKIKKNV